MSERSALIDTSREEILADLFNAVGDWSSRVHDLTTKYEVSRSTIYRWLSRYRDVAAPLPLIPMQRGVVPGTRKLDQKRERPVTKVIEEKYRTRLRPDVEEICRIVNRRRVADGLTPIARKAVRARIKRLEPRTVATARQGSKTAQNRYAQRAGHFPVDRILQSVQIDHALADVIVVDERDRLSKS